jgi:hypothetical protein
MYGSDELLTGIHNRIGMAQFHSAQGLVDDFVNETPGSREYTILQKQQLALKFMEMCQHPERYKHMARYNSQNSFRLNLTKTDAELYKKNKLKKEAVARHLKQKLKSIVI